jgi:hypothetical protein
VHDLQHLDGTCACGLSSGVCHMLCHAMVHCCAVTGSHAMLQVKAMAVLVSESGQTMNDLVNGCWYCVDACDCNMRGRMW